MRLSIRAILVSEAPSLEAHAVRLLEADLQQVLVDVSLLLQASFVPAVFVWTVVRLKLVASNIDLGEVDLETELGVSLNVFADRVVMLVIVVDVDVALEADTIDGAASLREVLDQVIHLVGLSLVPSSHGCMLVIVVEKFNLWVGIASSLEGLADVVVDDRPR